MSLSGGFASRQYVASRSGSLHPNHWSLTSPGLVSATLAALPPTRAAPAHACSSFACQAVALAKAGASSFVCPLLLCPSYSHRQGPEVCPSRQARDFEAVTGLTTQAQRPGPREAWIATRARWPGSLQRMVRPRFVAASHWLVLAPKNDRSESRRVTASEFWKRDESREAIEQLFAC